MEYRFRDIEKKWQERWAKEHCFRTPSDPGKPKYYVLDMFPYPSGAGLHVGHPLGYIASDIIARYKRTRGYNVLHPMGYDSFGLPAEQYAIQTGQHPSITTEKNISRFREQLDKMGLSYDWEREVRTSDPAYYHWTQWIFLKLYHAWYNRKNDRTTQIEILTASFEKNGNAGIEAACDEDTPVFSASEWNAFSETEKQDILMKYRIAYLSEAFVWWCPALGSVLANDEVKEGVSERGGFPVERKKMKQWSMRITAYADRLLNDLDGIQWSESIKEAQRNWIGKSEGGTVRFNLIPAPSPQEKGTSFAYETWDSANIGTIGEFARENRKSPTQAEKKLWDALRNNQLGYKIRRQHVIDSYIVDFVCILKRLAIEIDGKYHESEKDADAARTLKLKMKGFTVIRFSNEEVLSDIKKVVSDIKGALDIMADVTYPPLSFGEGLGGEVGNHEGNETLEVFTTRPDTLFGVTFITLAPEHELVERISTPAQLEKVQAYIRYAKGRSERDRQSEVKKITGEFTGAYAKHPFTGEDIPIWIGEYVLAGYGTGAVMGVPAHDVRDHAFAKHFGLKIQQVIDPGRPWDFSKEAYEEKSGKSVNSSFLDGKEVKDAIRTCIAELEKKGKGTGKVNYRLRDAVFGRQRYWGEPIPIYYKNGIPYPLSENELPLELPRVDKYLPTETGEPPLARAKDWKYKGQYEYEHTTMPGWAGSSWYFLRYMDPKNTDRFVSREAADYWQDVDFYIGGAEHATGHLLYVRFWTKALFDLGLISVKEPAKRLVNQGMIQGTSAFAYRINGTNQFVSAGLKENYQTTAIHADVSMVTGNEMDVEAFKKWREDLHSATFILENGKYLVGNEVEKMSKSKYNVVSPDEMCEKFGADTFRMYEMFLGPLELSKPWNTNGITGVYGFIKKFWKLFPPSPPGEGPGVRQTGEQTPQQPATPSELKILHKTIKKITEDIENLSLNTSVSAFMICVNELTELNCSKREILEPLLILLSPFAPHVCEELWEKLGHRESITYAQWPEYNLKLLEDDSFAYPVQFNGKTRFNIELPVTLSKEEIEKAVLSAEQTQKYLAGNAVKKVIVVPRRIVNVVC